MRQYRQEHRNWPKVSIHASVKDATAVMYGNLLGTKVSIHASVKDATTCQLRLYYREGVSIHASVKDATPHRKKQIYCRQFQSTHL